MKKTNKEPFDYIKSLKEWCELKMILWMKSGKTIFKQGEIWWCSVGVNLGEEIFGKGEKFTRPVLIFKKLTSSSFLGLPLTTQEKLGSWYVEITIHGKRNWVMLNQARILDKKRITNRLVTLDDADLKKVRDKFLEFYGS
ncbi:MAG: type II toxin-antitoxin system PemK/MazF family toxin [Candidatus Paceibacterota bacterium]|jgi:mRNA-degrading endonuclease toxin of MazEF toxin-antitoxin module